MTKKTLLAIDVGNSSTSMGLFEKRGPKKASFRLLWEGSTQTLRQPKTWTPLISRLRKLCALSLKPSSRNDTLVQAAFVSSVVPTLNKTIHRHIKTLSLDPPVFVSTKTAHAPAIRYKKPAELGADRLVNAKGALALRRGPMIVVDFGTASTFDCISKNGAYLGGMICPGPAMAAEALYLKTAKLPWIKLREEKNPLGQTTESAIQAGLYFGYRGLTREIILALKKKLGPDTWVFATGGQVTWLLKSLDVIDQFVPEMTLWGLYHWWEDFERGKT